MSADTIVTESHVPPALAMIEAPRFSSVASTGDRAQTLDHPREERG